MCVYDVNQMCINFSPIRLNIGESIVLMKMFEFEFFVDIYPFWYPLNRKKWFSEWWLSMSICVWGGMCKRLETRLLIRLSWNYYLRNYSQFLSFFLFKGILHPKNVGGFCSNDFDTNLMIYSPVKYEKADTTSISQNIGVLKLWGLLWTT
jgi:hypothetical protein